MRHFVVFAALFVSSLASAQFERYEWVCDKGGPHMAKTTFTLLYPSRARGPEPRISLDQGRTSIGMPISNSLAQSLMKQAYNEVEGTYDREWSNGNGKTWFTFQKNGRGTFSVMGQYFDGSVGDVVATGCGAQFQAIR